MDGSDATTRVRGLTRAQFLKLVGAGSLGALLVDCAPAASGPSPSVAASASLKPETLSLRFSFKAAGHHAPFLIGVDKGFFTKEAIILDYSEGKGSADTAKVVGAGQYDVGYADHATMANAVTAGVPVKAIYGVMQKNPQAMAFRADAGINEPKDLKGKRIAISAAGAETVLVPAFLGAVGLKPEDVVFVTVQSGGVLGSDLMLQGRADVAFTFQTDKPLPYRAEKQGIAIKTMFFADYGVNTLNHGLFARPETLTQSPDRIKRFLRAYSASWQYTIDHRDEAVQSLLSHFKEQNLDPVLTRLELDNTIATLRTKNSEGKPLGWMAPQDWQTTIDILSKFGGMANPQPAANYYTNDFIPA